MGAAYEKLTVICVACARGRSVVKEQQATEEAHTRAPCWLPRWVAGG